MEYYLVIKENTLLIDITTWMGFQRIILSGETNNAEGYVIYRVPTFM